MMQDYQKVPIDQLNQIAASDRVEGVMMPGLTLFFDKATGRKFAFIDEINQKAYVVKEFATMLGGAT